MRGTILLKLTHFLAQQIKLPHPLTKLFKLIQPGPHLSRGTWDNLTRRPQCLPVSIKLNLFGIRCFKLFGYFFGLPLPTFLLGLKACQCMDPVYLTAQPIRHLVGVSKAVFKDIRQCAFTLVFTCLY